MKQVSAFQLFLLALWWPLPLLPGFRWEDVIAPLGLTIFALITKGLANAPGQAPYHWQPRHARHRIAWSKLLLALIGLQAVLVVFIRIFGSGREQAEPYAGSLAPLAEMLTNAVPKFSYMASKLVEMEVPERVNVVVIAWAIAYAGQIVLAAIWAPPLWRRLREMPPPLRAANAPAPTSVFVRGTCILFVIVLLVLALLYPEASELAGRRDFFHEFETRDGHLLYRVVFHATLYWQVAILCLMYPIAVRRTLRLEPQGQGS